MVVKVLFRIGHSLSLLFDGLSLGRGSMLLRLRRVSLGMLCLVGVVGFGLIAFIAQLDWPQMLSGPLPGTPAKVGRVDEAIGLTAPSRARPGIAPGHAQRVRTSGRRGQLLGSPTRRSGLGRSRDLAAAPAQPSPGAAQPVAPVPSGAGEDTQPTAPAPTPSTVPVAAATGVGGSSKDGAKATADRGRAAGLAASRSQGQKSSAKSSTPAGSSPASSAAAKARRDESAAAETPAPASAAETKPSTPAANPASAKEAADAAKSQ